MFLAISLFLGINTLAKLDVGSLEEMGAGFFPLSLCMILLGLGLAILFSAPRDTEAQMPVNWRAVLLISSAPIAFGLTVRSLGLVPALLISVALAVMASRKIRLLHGVLVVAGVTVFCVAVFKFGVRVPFPLINPSL
ncbi:MAG: tripartite tricarboxylate transporter TctB family protein [Pseudomonadota bacterium]